MSSNKKEEKEEEEGVRRTTNLGRYRSRDIGLLRATHGTAQRGTGRKGKEREKETVGIDVRTELEYISTPIKDR